MTDTAKKMPLLETRGLKKTFGTLEVLKGVDMHIQKGEVLSLIGPSGSGKSTLLRCLNRLEEPTGGQIFLKARISPPRASIWISTARRWAWCFSSSMCSRT